MTNARDNFDDDNLDDDFAAFREDLSLADDMPAVDDIDDEFEQLRRKSARGESLDDDLDSDDAFFSEESSSGSGFAWRDFTPGQRLALALLVLLNIVMGTIGLLVITGNLG